MILGNVNLAMKLMQVLFVYVNQPLDFGEAS